MPAMRDSSIPAGRTLAIISPSSEIRALASTPGESPWNLRNTRFKSSALDIVFSFTLRTPPETTDKLSLAASFPVTPGDKGGGDAKDVRGP